MTEITDILEHARTASVVILEEDLAGFLEDIRTFFPKPTAY